MRRMRGTDEIIVCPPCPEKMEFVSDGTITMPTQNVPMTATACSAYTPYSADVIVGGSVVTYRKTNCSKIMRKAMATTGMNEYWMNDFSQPQNSHSSFGTMKKEWLFWGWL